MKDDHQAVPVAGSVKVLKFGGSSVRDADTIKRVIDIVKDSARAGQKIVVVVSAFQGVSDTLSHLAHQALKSDISTLPQLKELHQRHLDTARSLVASADTVVAYIDEIFAAIGDILKGVKLVQDLTARTLDALMSHGELLSSNIIAEAAKEKIPTAGFLDARQLIKTNRTFGGAAIDYDLTNTCIRETITNDDTVPIIPGFIGSSALNETTTLGRGGSDLSATIIGAALNAEVVELWTDVDGVMTADPSKVKQALPIPLMSYDEVMELSHFGAQVLFPPALVPVMQHNIPLLIKNTLNPEVSGTEISRVGGKEGQLITGISSIDHVAVLRIEGAGMVGACGIASRVFAAMAHRNISVIMITQCSSEHSICFSILPHQSDEACEALEEEFSLEIASNRIDRVIVEPDAAMIAVVGKNMCWAPGVSGKLFDTLARNGINVMAIAQGSSELNITCVVSRDDEKKALNVIHEAFFLSKTVVVNLFVVGTGLVGSTLFRQLDGQVQHLRKEYSLDIRVIGIANTKTMCFDTAGIDLSDWKAFLKGNSQPMNLGQYIETMRSLNLGNTLFVDCSASQDVADSYEEVLSNNISIVTPNKKACASRYEYYQRLKDLAKTRPVKFSYEANIGAALPIIRTVQDLVMSGDKILKCEGILSGTLSYLFNTFDGTIPFSELVRQAKQQGFTEPDPRDDLSGMDVVRKLLILARECGYPLEIEDITVQKAAPDRCFNVDTVDAFFEQLQKADDEIATLFNEAKNQGKALRYIARLNNGKASVNLETIDNSHPFYHLSEADNIIALTTERYNTRPLVIRGPGAGAEVTAGEVFADIIRMTNR